LSLQQLPGTRKKQIWHILPPHLEVTWP